MTLPALSFRVRARRGEFLLDAAFEAETSGITVVLGPSAAGKSSLLRALAGLLRAEGDVRVGDAIWQEEARGLFLPTHRREIGYVFQEDALFAHTTVRVTLELGERFVPRRLRRFSFSRVVEAIGLGALLDRPTSELSGGQRRRVALGRALLTSPRLLLLDEPLTGLDAPARIQLSRCLKQIGDEFALPQVHVSHSLTDALRVADRLLLLEDGRIVDSGLCHEVLTRGLHEGLFPSSRGVLWIEAGRRSWIREDQLLLFDAPHRLSSAALGFAARLDARRELPDGRVELTCSREGLDFRMRLTAERVAALSLDIGATVHVQATSLEPLD